MITRITFPNDGVTAQVDKSTDGNVDITPSFRTPTDMPTVAYIESVVTTEGGKKALHRYLLVQSGKDAKLRLINCSHRATPRFYAAKPAATPNKGAKNG